jgi:hypothetical protein
MKHIRDVDLNRDDETNGPLPSSRYPKTLLAITAAAVSYHTKSNTTINGTLTKG